MAVTPKYKYPLESQDDYKAYVTFTSVEYEPISLFGAEFLANANSQPRIENQNIGEDVNASNVTETQKQELENFQALQRTSNVKNRIGTEKEAVRLYLPPGFSVRDNVTYENFDLGSSGAIAEAGMGGAAVGDLFSGGLSSFINQFNNGNMSRDMANLGAAVVANKFGSFSDEIEGAIKIAGGVTINPNTRVLFKQSNIREFSFAFKLIARSSKEAREIEEIVKFFRTEIYPEDIPLQIGQNTSISLGYKFPRRFRIRMFYDGTEMGNLPKIMDCYLRDVSTTYNSSTMAFHKDGQPLEIDLTLSFQETRAMTKKDVKAGY